MTSSARRLLKWSAAFCTAVALLSVPVATLRAAPPAQGSPGAGKGKAAAAHVDALLADLLAGGDDNGRVRVILSVKPGAKHGLIRALQAHGAVVGSEFTLIEGFAADL